MGYIGDFCDLYDVTLHRSRRYAGVLRREKEVIPWVNDGFVSIGNVYAVYVTNTNAAHRRIRCRCPPLGPHSGGPFPEFLPTWVRCQSGNNNSAMLNNGNVGLVVRYEAKSLWLRFRHDVGYTGRIDVYAKSLQYRLRVGVEPFETTRNLPSFRLANCIVCDQMNHGLRDGSATIIHWLRPIGCGLHTMVS